MIILPAIDLFDGQAVRLLHGDYAQMTVYNPDPSAQAQQFRAAGARWLHMVDLQGALHGDTPNFEVVKSIARDSGLLVEIGGGVRDRQTVERYLAAGVRRVILGTAAVTQPGLVAQLAQEYGDAVAVGVDIRDGLVAVKGWTELSERSYGKFIAELEDCGIQTVICTDISRDGALRGTNLELYAELHSATQLNIIASGGITALAEIERLAAGGTYGAILGKSLYAGEIDLAAAIKIAGSQEEADDN